MCLAFPAQIVELLPAEQAVVDLDGVRKTVSVLLLEDVKVGEFVMVHVGFALAKVDAEEAAQTLALMKEAMALTGPLPQPEDRFHNALDGIDVDNPAQVPGRSPGRMIAVPRIAGPLKRRHPVEVRDTEVLAGAHFGPVVARAKP